MELDELKSIWKHSEPAFQQKDEEEIARMLKGRSQSIVSKLKRNVWFELIFTLVVGTGMLIYAFTLTGGALRWTSVSLLLLSVAYSAYYIKKLSLLNRFDAAAENVRNTIGHLVNNLTTYLKFYKRSYAILYPTYFGLGLSFGALEIGTTRFMEVLGQPRTIILLISTAVVFFFASTSLASWYLKKLYGNHLEKLRGLLKDLQG